MDEATRENVLSLECPLSGCGRYRVNDLKAARSGRQ
jgi:hypothetical protein